VCIAATAISVAMPLDVALALLRYCIRTWHFFLMLFINCCFCDNVNRVGQLWPASMNARMSLILLMASAFINVDQWLHE